MKLYRMFYSPDDGEGSSAPVEEYLSPRDMFINDLMAEEQVGSPSDVASVEAEQVTDDNTQPNPDEVAQAVEAGNEINQAQPVQPQGVTADDLSRLRDEILGKINQPAPLEPIVPPAEAQEQIPDPYDPSTFTDKFYEDPRAAIEELVNARAEEIVKGRMSQLQPLLEQAKAAEHKENVRGIINDFVNRTSDARNFLPQMTTYIQQNNLAVDDPRSYQDAYNASKLASQSAELESLRASKSMTLDDYMRDPGSLESIVNNPQIKERIINSYLNGIQNGSRPVTITSTGAGQPAAQSPVAPKSFQDAASLFANDLNR